MPKLTSMWLIVRLQTTCIKLSPECFGLSKSLAAEASNDKVVSNLQISKVYIFMNKIGESLWDNM